MRSGCRAAGDAFDRGGDAASVAVGGPESPSVVQTRSPGRMRATGTSPPGVAMRVSVSRQIGQPPQRAGRQLVLVTAGGRPHRDHVELLVIAVGGETLVGGKRLLKAVLGNDRRHLGRTVVRRPYAYRLRRAPANQRHTCATGRPSDRCGGTPPAPPQPASTTTTSTADASWNSVAVLSLGLP